MTNDPDPFTKALSPTPQNEYPHYVQPLFEQQVDFETFPPETTNTPIPPEDIDSPFNLSPRDGLDGFPGYSDEDLMELQAQGPQPGNHEEAVVAAEFDMTIRPAVNQHLSGIPPRPMTIQELDLFFRRCYPLPKSEYDITVMPEDDTIKDTLVGVYRDRLDADVLQFQLHHADGYVNILLAPDTSPYGFGWYAGSPMEEGSGMDSLFESLPESPQPLEELLADSDKTAAIKDIPARIQNAAALINEPVTPDNPSPTPDGWVTTDCQRSNESELFQARFEASFVHEESGAVVEIKPLPPDTDKVTIESESGPAGDAITIAFEPNTDEDAGDHEWRLAFADNLVGPAAEIFPNPVSGEEIPDLLAWLNTRLTE